MGVKKQGTGNPFCCCKSQQMRQDSGAGNNGRISRAQQHLEYGAILVPVASFTRALKCASGAGGFLLLGGFSLFVAWSYSLALRVILVFNLIIL